MARGPPKLNIQKKRNKRVGMGSKAIWFFMSGFDCLPRTRSFKPTWQKFKLLWNKQTKLKMSLGFVYDFLLSQKTIHLFRVHFFMSLWNLWSLFGRCPLSRDPKWPRVLQFQQNLVEKQLTFRFQPVHENFPFLIPDFSPWCVQVCPHPFGQFQPELVQDWLHFVLRTIV